MDNINSHINVKFFQKTTGRSRESSTSFINEALPTNLGLLNLIFHGTDFKNLKNFL